MAVASDPLDEETKITFRLDERTKRKIGMRARSLGMDMSEYLRWLAEDDLDAAGIDDSDIPSLE